MSAVFERTKTTTRHEYVIPSPACWSDVKLAMLFATQARDAAGLSNDFDDVIKVDSENDENIIVFWEEVTK